MRPILILQALDLFAELGDVVGQASAHSLLGSVVELRNRPAAEALAHHRRAVALFASAGDRHGQAWALNNAGWHHVLHGDHHQAIALGELALALNGDSDDPRIEACALYVLGYAHYHIGSYLEAGDYYRKSLASCQQTRVSYFVAWVLGSLGDTLKAAGNRTAARAAWRQALAIFDHLGPVAVLGPGPGFPDADQVQAKLTALDQRE